MGKIKVRYLVVKRQKHGPIFYWQPNKTLRQAGHLPRRLAERTNDIVDAIHEAEELNRKLDKWRSGVERIGAPPGSLPDLIRRYRQDPRFTDLRASTQQEYDGHIRRIEAWSERAGHPPLKTITRKGVKAFARSLAATPGRAKHVISVLRILFDFAIDEGEFQGINPALRMRLKHNPPRDQVWADDQITAVIQAATAAGRHSIALAIALAHNTGQREGDILHMAWSQLDGTMIRLRQRKTGVLLDVPCTQQLIDVLAVTPRTGTLMVMSEETGQIYCQKVFYRWFRRICQKAGIPDDLQFRDLRRTAVVRLAEASCSVPKISAISGHSINRTAQILEVYCPRNTTMARNAIMRLEDYRRTQRERKLEG
jgi:integrase